MLSSYLDSLIRGVARHNLGTINGDRLEAALSEANVDSADADNVRAAFSKVKSPVGVANLSALLTELNR